MTEHRKHWLSPCPACGNRLLLFSACTVKDGMLTKTYLCAGSACAAVCVLREPIARVAWQQPLRGRNERSGRPHEVLLASVNVG